METSSDPVEQNTAQENALHVFLSFIAFMISFIITWLISSRKFATFDKFQASDKADWCSRVNSTIHAMGITIGITIAFFTIDWTSDFIPLSSIRFSETLFSFAIGYFLFDLFVVIYWKVPMWKVFVIHHVVAVTPYIISNLVTTCISCHYELLLFLLVELATLPLNVRGFVESLDLHDTRTHYYAIVVTYIIWGVARVALPIYLIVSFWRYAYPSPISSAECLYPSMVCGHIIGAFCVGVFFFVHTPELLKLWKNRTAPEMESQLDRANSNIELPVSYPRNLSISGKDKDSSCIYQSQGSV